MTFAPEHDVAVPYMQRTRDYYLKLGYGNPYRWAHYAEVPFTPVPVPDMPLRMSMTLEALAGYISTWSAMQRYREATGADPMPVLVDALAAAWGDPHQPRSTSWPLAVKAGRVAATPRL